MRNRTRSILRVLLGAWLAAALLAAGGAARALDLAGEDTDLFLTNPSIASQVPNVLIVLDNTSNWSAANQGWSSTEITSDSVCGTSGAGFVGTKQGNAELCAIYKVVATLTDTVNVGLMMINDQDGGGYVRFPMKSMNATNRAALQAIAKSIDNTGITDPSFKTSANTSMEHVMNDAFRYFNSLATYGGSGAASTLADASAYTSSTKTNFSFANASTSSCGYDYIIFIGNGWPSGNESTSQLNTSMTAAAALLNDATNVTPNTTPTAAACQGGNCNNTDAWSRFMYNYGAKVAPGSYRHITTYTVDVCKDACDANQANLLSSMANVSYGRYYRATNLAAITTALSNIFTQVQAVNSVFAATTLPVSINVRGTNLNQVYIGVFKPDANLSPRWLGNLKQYELGVANTSTGQLQLVDASGTAAVNLNTGFIANTARSYWTTTSTYWSFRSPFKPTDAGGASDSPDGDLVEKGGAAQRVREVYPLPDSTAAQTRKIYTCTGACLSTTGFALSGTLFNKDNSDITSELLGTFRTVTLTSLTGSTTTATGVAHSHGFNTGDQVTVAGAVPNLYNGTFAVTKVDSDTFTYSLSPNTPDTTNAYVTLNTLSASGLNTSTDRITVTGATPSDYNVTDATISAVAGNTNQVSYALGSSPTAAASGYTVTAKRRISAGNLTWSSGTGRATVTLANHGYSTSDSVTISGVTDGVSGPASTYLNGTFAIEVSNANSFSFATSGTPAGGTVSTGVATTATPSGFTWGNGDTVRITQLTGTGNFATATTGATVSAASGNSFTYSTSGIVSGTATGTFKANRLSTTDILSFNVSIGASWGGGNKNRLRLTLSSLASQAVAGQAMRALTVGDTIAVTGVNCTATSGKSTVTVSGCSTTNSTTYSITITHVNDLTSGSCSTFTCTISYTVSGGSVDSVSLSSARVYWAASAANPTLSADVNVTGIVAGSASVTGGGTMYAAKTGDLTSRVTSIVNQGIATGTITAGLATNADTNERENLINWVRGIDNKDNENGGSTTTDVRASVHGDVLHSRPAVINYNRNGDDNDVFIFYGANDGMFHAIQGGRATGGGNEQWAFIAQEHFGKLKRLRNQTPIISSTNPRDYFFDGPIGAYTLDANSNFKLGDSGDKVYLFVGMRRGGRYIYALDVSDPTNPKFLWKKGCPNTTGTTGCDAGYAEMGQSWSEPKLGYVRAFPGTLVLMFGAGYDAPVEDLQPCGVTAWSATSVTGKTNVVFPNSMTAANCGTNLTGGTTTTRSRTMGRGIYMVNALTGAVLWRAVSPNATAETVTGMTSVSVTGMDYAIAADLSVLRNRTNTGSRGGTGTESVPTGYLDRIYGVDTGGQVWRVDVADATIANWTVTKLAKVTPTSGTTSASMRKFLFAPDVVYSTAGDGTSYDAVLLGSGDREHPFDQTVANRFYMFKDTYSGTITPAMLASASPPTTILESDLFDVTNNCLQTASSCSVGQTQDSAAASLNAARGWILQLASTGEKTIATATTSAGTVIFNTNEPKQDNVSGTAPNVGPNAGNFCTSDLGTARQYGINYQTAVSSNIYTALPTQFQSASGRYATFAGGGFLPAPVPVVVSIGGKYYQTVISGVQATNPGGLSLQTRVRTYWYKKTN